MGMGMVFLYESRGAAGWTDLRVLRHFVVRGLLLIVLQFIDEDPVWMLGGLVNHASPLAGKFIIFFGILNALGANMILGAVLLLIQSKIKKVYHYKTIKISVGTLFLLFCAFAFTITSAVVLHYADPSTDYDVATRYLMIPGQVHILFFGDCVIPWLGVTSFGLFYGRVFQAIREDHMKYYVMLFTGIFLWCSFALIRVLGVTGVLWFGNIRLPPHEGTDQFLQAMFSLSKYPPSIAYICLFLGAVLIITFLIYRSGFSTSKIAKPANVFGRSSLFFYCLHLWIYLGLGAAWNRARYNLPIYYAYPLWILGLFILYPLCLKWGTFKGRQPFDSIWKLF